MCDTRHVTESHTSSPLPAQVRAQIVWEDVDRVPVLAANQFILQVAAVESPEDIADTVLTIGYLSPPVILGTPEEQQVAAAALERVSVRPSARFIIPIKKAAELAQIIQELVERVEAAKQQP